MKFKNIIFAVFATAIYIITLASFLKISSMNIAVGTLSIVTLFIVSLLSGKVLIKSTVPALRKFSPFFYTLSLIVGIVFVSGFTVMAAQNFISLKRAEKLIDNINQYKYMSGHFPNSLEELTPEFYSEIPKASKGFTGSEFFYIAENNNKTASDISLYENATINYKLIYKSTFGVEYKYISQLQRWEASSEYDIDKIKSVEITEPVAGFFLSSRFSKKNNNQ
ncbi:MAG: hypothetical protein KGZ97_00180 [Bacteroidetes bacterium]|nr:hypothetical protein [Bacteroidota bacterium]